MVIQITKICSACKVEKTLDEFPDRSRGKHGKDARCKDCRNLYMRSYYADNIIAQREYKRNWNAQHYYECKKRLYSWRNANPEKYRELARDSYHRNVKDVSKRRRARYKTNPHKIRTAVRKYQDEHPEIGKAIKRRRRARKAGVNEYFTASMGKFVRRFWGNQCAICGKTRGEEGRALPIDHWLPLANGHALTMENAVLMCGACNCSKGKRLPHQIYDRKTVIRIEDSLKAQANARKQLLDGEWDWERGLEEMRKGGRS